MARLLASGAVKLLPGGMIKAVRRTASQGGADPATIAQMGEAVSALIAAFEQNLSKGPGEQLPVRGVSRAAPESVVPLFRAQKEGGPTVTQPLLLGSTGGRIRVGTEITIDGEDLLILAARDVLAIAK